MFENDCECYGKKPEKCCTDKIIIAVVLVLFAFVIGVIVGALTDLFATLGLAAFIIIAVALGIILLIRLAIFAICCSKKC